MIEADDEGVMKHATDIFLVFNNILFLVLEYELLMHDFHRIKLSIF
jgi:hypothetical protein